MNGVIWGQETSAKFMLCAFFFNEVFPKNRFNLYNHVVCHEEDYGSPALWAFQGMGFKTNLFVNKFFFPILDNH